MEKITMSSIREQFPMYADVPDDQLLIAVRKKYYNDIPMGQFVQRIQFDAPDPSAGGGTLQIGPFDTGIRTPESVDRFLSGAGKSFADLGRTAKRIGSMLRIGDYDEKEAQEDAELDKPLMNTTAGTVGKFAGDLALTAVPGYRAQQAITQGVRGAATVLPRAVGAVARGTAPYVGAAGSGAAVGAALSPEDLSGGAAIGALGGTAGEAGGRVLSAAYRGGKAIFEPLTETGRERILRRTLERYATDPAAVRAAAQNPQVLVPGVMPTLAEATLDPGIAQLQRGAMSASPDVASAIAESRGRQVAGYRSVLDDLAGNQGQRATAEAAREASANQLYGRAYAGGLNITPALQQQADDLMQLPAMQQAVAAARTRAANRGMNLTDAAGSVQGLHFAKLELDDMISAARRAGRGGEASDLMGVQQRLLGFLEQASPDYGAARRTYAQMSRPINQMDIGQELRDRALPALDDLSNGSLSRVNANRYAQALRNADQTARQATGRTGAAMADVMDPAQMARLQGVGQDMARYASAQELARVPGSPTAQYLGAQNVIRQFLGPLGIPQSAADSMIGRVASGLLGFPFRITQSQTEQLLARALTEPTVAARLMAARDPRTVMEILQPFAAQFAVQASTQ